MDAKSNHLFKTSKRTFTDKKKEKSFQLSFPALVSGLDARGNKFKEKTKISSISSQFTSFNLETKVTLGTILDLTIDIPETFLLEKKMKMYLSGQVSRVLYNKNGRKNQLIFLHLKKKYKIQPSSPS